jgi:hypothetical protein
MQAQFVRIYYEKNTGHSQPAGCGRAPKTRFQPQMDTDKSLFASNGVNDSGVWSPTTPNKRDVEFSEPVIQAAELFQGVFAMMERQTSPEEEFVMPA